VTSRQSELKANFTTAEETISSSLATKSYLTKMASVALAVHCLATGSKVKNGEI